MNADRSIVKPSPLRRICSLLRTMEKLNSRDGRKEVPKRMLNRKSPGSCWNICTRSQPLNCRRAPRPDTPSHESTCNKSVFGLGVFAAIAFEHGGHCDFRGCVHRAGFPDPVGIYGADAA